MEGKYFSLFLVSAIVTAFILILKSRYSTQLGQNLESPSLEIDWHANGFRELNNLD